MRSFMIAISCLLATFPLTLAVGAGSGSLSAYEAFRKKHGRSAADTVPLEQRFALFQANVKEVERHNSVGGSSWVAEVNQFADYTPDEFKYLLGHQLSRHQGVGSSSFLEKVHETVPVAGHVLAEVHENLPGQVDWRQQMNVSFPAKAQGGCGSCWAVAAAGAIESQVEIASKGSGPPIFPISYEEITDCSPNPQECGGKGGCSGATAEIALEYVQKHGVYAQDGYRGYQTGGSGKCEKGKGSKRMLIEGFVRLEENKLQPLMKAIATTGPVVVSVDGSTIGSYAMGVFDSCPQNAIINHAVLNVGYGHDAKLNKDYWIIRNSWGPNWGDKGYFRMLRHASDVGDAGWCGIDNKPLEGVGCKGGPPTLPVCGMCGVLSDSAYPIGVSVYVPGKVETAAVSSLPLPRTNWWRSSVKSAFAFSAVVVFMLLCLYTRQREDQMQPSAKGQ